MASEIAVKEDLMKLLKLFPAINLCMALCGTAWSAAPGKLAAKPKLLKFTLDEVTKIESTLESEADDFQELMDGVENPKRIKTATRCLMEKKIVKVFPDGCALAASKTLKVEKGETLKNLAAVAVSEGPSRQESYSLLTPEGSIYAVSTDPMLEPVSDLETLQKAKEASQWLQDKTSIHSLKFPAKPLKLNEETTWTEHSMGRDETWAIVRQGDEEVDGTLCEVYDARRTILSGDTFVEILYYSRPEQKILKRIIRQVGDNPVESIDRVVR